jgi:hypothetical protein
LFNTFTHPEFTMIKTLLSLAALSAFGASAFAASTSASDSLVAAVSSAQIVKSSAHGLPCKPDFTTVAKHGKDDGPGHDRGDDKGGRGKPEVTTVAKHGKDDGPGHDRGDDKGGRGKPDVVMA